MGAAYACRINLANMQAIASEKPDFNEEEFLTWLKENGVGYFLRDDTSSLNCKYIPATDFLDAYTFEHGDKDSLFRQVVKI